MALYSVNRDCMHSMVNRLCSSVATSALSDTCGMLYRFRLSSHDIEAPLRISEGQDYDLSGLWGKRKIRGAGHRVVVRQIG